MPDRGTAASAVKDREDPIKDRDPLDPSPYTFERQYRGRRFGFIEPEAREYLRIRKLSTEKRTVPDPDTGLDREVEFYNRETEEKLLRTKCVKELDPETGAPLSEPTDYESLGVRVYTAINNDIAHLLYDPEEDELAKKQAKADKDAEDRGLPLGNG